MNWNTNFGLGTGLIEWSAFRSAFEFPRKYSRCFEKKRDAHVSAEFYIKMNGPFQIIINCGGFQTRRICFRRTKTLRKWNKNFAFIDIHNNLYNLYIFPLHFCSFFPSSMEQFHFHLFNHCHRRIIGVLAQQLAEHFRGICRKWVLKKYRISRNFSNFHRFHCSADDFGPIFDPPQLEILWHKWVEEQANRDHLQDSHFK